MFGTEMHTNSTRFGSDEMPGRFAKKRDASELEIVRALEVVGAEVWRGDDFDLTVAFRGRWQPLEVKSSAAAARRGGPTAQTQAHHRERAAKCNCKIPVVWTPEMALEAIGATKGD